MLRAVLFKAELWERINQNPVNDRQRFIINRMLEPDFEGHMNTPNSPNAPPTPL